MIKQLVYWDSSTFLALFNKDESPVNCELCEDVWHECEKGKTLLITSTLTIAETIFLKGTPKLDPAKRPLVNNFFRAEHIILKPLTRTIAELARDIVWDVSIHPKDAIHIATAVTYKIGIIHTFDKGLLSRNTLTVNGFLLNIRQPYAPRQTEIKEVNKQES
jgi:predicted nucleic acid-binding protein